MKIASDVLVCFYCCDKTPQPKWLIGDSLHSWYQKVIVWDGAANARKPKERRAHILKGKREAEKANWEWRKSLKPQSLPAVTHFL